MLHKILVAIDGSEARSLVFSAALELAKSTGATLILLHVLTSEEDGSPIYPAVNTAEYLPTFKVGLIETYQEQWQSYEQRSLENLRSLSQEATLAGVTVECTQHSGSAGRSICEVANTSNADLVVIGRRGHSGLSKMLMGSVSNYVVHHAPCSVFIVHRATEITLGLG